MIKNKLPSLVVLTILTSITVSFWVLFTIYRSFISLSPSQVSEKVMLPISPTFDTNTIEIIKNKLYP